MSVDTSFSRNYRPWGQVRRKNLIARVLYGMMMTVAGLAVIAALILIAIFAFSVFVVGAAAVAVTALFATFLRKPVRLFVHTRDPKGVMEARKDGSTWTVY